MTMNTLVSRYIKSIIISFMLLLALFAAHDARAETIYLLGDSIVAESGNPGDTKMIQDLTGVQVINVAIGGTRTDQWLAKLAGVTADNFAPDSTVIINLGINDMFQGVPAATIQHNLDTLLTRLDGFGVKTILSVVPAIAQGSGAPASYTKSAWLSAPYGSVAPLYYAVGALHPATKIVNALSTIASIPGMVSGDGVHLTSAGSIIFNARLATEYNTLHGRAPITFNLDSIRTYVTSIAASPYSKGVICTMLALDCSAI
jgi:lysophospholipase L1-like esterase